MGGKFFSDCSIGICNEKEVHLEYNSVFDKVSINMKIMNGELDPKKRKIFCETELDIKDIDSLISIFTFVKRHYEYEQKMEKRNV